MVDFESIIGNAIIVWDYAHLPEIIKKFMEENNISNDDLDWIAIVDPAYKDMYIHWLECPAFGCFDVSNYPIGSMGHTLILGYHS